MPSSSLVARLGTIQKSVCRSGLVGVCHGFTSGGRLNRVADVDLGGSSAGCLSTPSVHNPVTNVSCSACTRSTGSRRGTGGVVIHSLLTAALRVIRLEDQIVSRLLHSIS